MIRALDTAAAGLIKAQRRASELAASIVETTAGRVSDGSSPGTSGSSNDGSASNSNMPANNTAKHSPQASLLVQQIVDFKATDLQFRTSATVFKRIADTTEESLGALLDKKS